MSNAPKTGFFHTIPGLMTAMAGLLSAATGAIVALNQTGVVDLKKVAGTKPPEQSTPLVNPSAPPSPEDKKLGLELSAGPGAADAKKQDGLPPATSIVPSEPTRSADAAPQRQTETKPSEAIPSPSATVNKSPDAAPPPVAEPKPQPSLPPPPSSTADAEKLKAIRDGAAAAAPKKEERPVTSAPQTPKRESVPPPPVQERVVETRPEPVKPAPSAPARETERPTTKSEPRPVDKGPQVVKAPPSPSDHDKGSPSRPGPKDSVADARQPHRPATTDDDAKQPKIVRPPSDAVAARGGGKRLVTDDEASTRKGPEGVREAHSAGAGGNRQLDLTGLKMTIPAGWAKEEVKPGPLAPVAALRIPDPGGDGTVQITRYIGAKGKEMEDHTIEHWVGQVTKANGAPMTLADAKIERRQVGPVRITTVDLSGTVKMTPRDTGDRDSRMISAIIDHPAGPHLVTIVGPARSMSKWDAALDEFLKSAKPD